MGGAQHSHLPHAPWTCSEGGGDHQSGRGYLDSPWISFHPGAETRACGGAVGAEVCCARFSQALGRATRGSDPGHTNPGAAYATNAGQSPKAVHGPRWDRMLQLGRKGQLLEQSGWGDRKLPSTGGVGPAQVPEGRRPTSPEERCEKVSSASVSGSGQTFWPPEWSELGPCIHCC